ncbi:MAG: protein kinase [Polyangiaceae bacterium]
MQLEVLRARGILDTWHSQRLVTGEVIRDREADEMARADILLLLISADSSPPSAREIERKEALERHERGHARVVPVLLRPCLWEASAFGKLAPLPANGECITKWTNRDEAWREVAKRIWDLVKEDPEASAERETAAAPPQPKPRKGAPDPLARTDQLLRELEAAHTRKDALVARGEDITAIRAEIAKLKHELRAGGQLPQNDSLGDGRYYLLRELGRGGFATVWEADDREQGTRVAIKVLHPQHAQDPSRRERFFRGARAMARLDHPNIVRVLVPHEEDAGFLYFVMELLPGGDLHRAVLDGRVPHERVVPLISSVGEALSAAHAHRFWHRDVSPQNILLDAVGQPKLSDFDLVAGVDTGGGTRTGAMGKFLYAAPEVMTRPQDADARADVYGLAMTAIFCLHGKDLPGIFVRHPEKVLSRFANSRVAAVLEQAISAEAEDRYPTVGAFCEALREAATPAAPAAVVEVAAPPPPEVSRASFQLTAPGESTSIAPLSELEPARLSAPEAFGGLPPDRSAESLVEGSSSAAPTGVLPRRAWTRAFPIAAIGTLVVSSIAASAIGVREGWFGGRADETGAVGSTTTMLTPLPSTRGPSIDPQVSPRSQPRWPACPPGMAYEPAGTFRMGSEPSDPEADDDEKKPHEVTLSAFCIDVTEATVARDWSPLHQGSSRARSASCPDHRSMGGSDRDGSERMEPVLQWRPR